MFSRTIGRKDLGILYESLFGLGMTTVAANLKWEGQNSKAIQALAMTTIFLRHVSLRMTGLRCLQKM